MKCKWCNGEIDKEKLSKYASGDFCSKSCARLYSRSKADNGELKRGSCSVCGKELWIKKRSNSKQVKCDDCRQTKKYNNDGLREKYCLNCGERITGKGRKYCSIECSKRKQKRRGYPLDEILAGKYPKYASSKLRKRLLNEGYKEHECEICGTREWNGYPVQLILDHIDGNPYNHLWENLRVVCPNCDAQSPFYCSKNIGNGRKYRRIKYHKDKEEFKEHTSVA